MKVSLLTSIVLLVICIGASIIYGLFSFRFSGYPALIPLVIVCWFIFKIVTFDRYWITRAVPYKLTKVLAHVVFFYYIGMFIFLFICAGIAVSHHSFYSEKIRFPLTDIEWISSRPDGTIYCLTRAHSRLQVFDPSGKFVKGWFVPVRGSFWISMCDNGDIIFWEKEGKPCVVFDQFGNYIEVTDDHKKVSPEEPTTKTFDQNGNTFKLKFRLSCPKIIKIDANGIEQTVVKDPVGIWQHTLPFFFAIWFFSGFIMCITSVQASSPAVGQKKGNTDC